jgi:predicted protein tyrosine phosphatase
MDYFFSNGVFMFTLRVCGLRDLPEEIEHFQPTHIVSAVETLADFPTYTNKHIHVSFSDIATPMEFLVAPEMEHLLAVLDFAKDLKDTDRVLVHCFAGISRSTALAIGICMQNGLSYAEAFAYVEQVRPVLSPNHRIITLIDEHFGLDGKLTELAVEFRRRIATYYLAPISGPSETEVSAMKELLQALQAIQE